VFVFHKENGMGSATKEKKPRRKAKQQTFEATKDVAGGVAELDQIGEELLEVASERGRLGEQLKGLKGMMLKAMQKHEKVVYKVGDATFEVEHIDDDELLVKRPKEKKKDQPDDGRDFGGE
jgi:hypothetical protein